ncbi:keratin-associated protein 13-1-like [Orycteropus afer afer]|uniref:Keratin-associated protein n=1 Tax=Orycteropus afer afer TaxID=1230840 RepID=A0A8B7A1B1_ORYAF|nr:keratin-associated protein 13-1-like [Orycteropus afer afer]
MSYNCCSGRFSSHSLSGCRRYPVPFCGSSSPSTDFCSLSTCQLTSSHYRRCQETCCEPSCFQKSQVVSIPCQTSCYRPRTSRLCSPCLTTYTGSLGICGFPSLGYGSGFCHSTYFPSRSCQSPCYRSTC